MTYAWSGASKEDQTAQVGGTLVAEGTGCVDQSGNTVGLDSTADQRASPRGNSAGGLLGLQELLLGVCSLSTVVGVTEDGGKDAQGSGVGEDSSQRNGGGLHGREV